MIEKKVKLRIADWEFICDILELIQHPLPKILSYDLICKIKEQLKEQKND